MLEFIVGAIVGHWVGNNISIDFNDTEPCGIDHNKIIILSTSSKFKDGKEFNSLQEAAIEAHKQSQTFD